MIFETIKRQYQELCKNGINTPEGQEKLKELINELPEIRKQMEQAQEKVRKDILELDSIAWRAQSKLRPTP